MTNPSTFNTQHHPSTDLLLQYSAGTASPSHALCVATHLEFCRSCRTAHQRNNAIGGRLIDDLGSDSLDQSGSNQANQVSSDVKANVMALLDNVEAEPAKPEANQREDKPLDRVPRALQRLVPEDFDSLNWKIVSTTARTYQLFKDDKGAQVGLLKIKPGGRIAKHKHLGNEYTVVLKGSISDEDGIYHAGDFILRSDDQNAHSPVATRDAECICLIFQEAPLQFTGWLFRWLNPWFRSQFQPS